jgi:hypothetical protein
MKKSPALLITALVTLLAATFAAHAEEPDIRLKVTNSSLGADKKGDNRVSQRQLTIKIDNRERDAFEGVTLEWFVIARDINNRKLSLAGSGSKKIDIPADDDSETTSDPFSFSKKDGKVERINRNRPDQEQFKVNPDTGTRYAGYVVRIVQDGKVIAEAATAGMKDRAKDLTKSPSKKKEKKKK